MKRGRPTKAEVEARKQAEVEARKQAEAVVQNEVVYVRPPTPVQEHHSEYDVSDIDELPPVKKKRVRLKKKVPDFWSDTYEKGLQMLRMGADDTMIKATLGWDKCFSKNTDKLKLSLEEYDDYIQEPLREDKMIIEKDYQEMDKDNRNFLKPTITADGGSKSLDELLEDKGKIEKELMYINYGIRLRQIYPSIKILGLMKSIIPEEKKLDLLTIDSQQQIEEEFDPMDAKLASDNEEDTS
jgi:hypothetical protein